MKFIVHILALWLIACVALSKAAGAFSHDVATQKVLKHYGMDSRILRPVSALVTTSPRSDGLFPFSLEGTPAIKVLLDRDYWVLSSRNAKRDNDVIAYILNPIDEQSALNITIGQGIHELGGAELSKELGFSGITRSEGFIGKQKVKWRRWSDQNHLYSDCTVLVSEAKSSYRINVTITANSANRRSALEKCMGSLRLAP